MPAETGNVMLTCVTLIVHAILLSDQPLTGTRYVRHTVYVTVLYMLLTYNVISTTPSLSTPTIRLVTILATIGADWLVFYNDITRFSPASVCLVGSCRINSRVFALVRHATWSIAIISLAKYNLESGVAQSMVFATVIAYFYMGFRTIVRMTSETSSSNIKRRTKSEACRMNTLMHASWRLILFDVAVVLSVCRMWQTYTQCKNTPSCSALSRAFRVGVALTTILLPKLTVGADTQAGGSSVDRLELPECFKSTYSAVTSPIQDTYAPS